MPSLKSLLPAAVLFAGAATASAHLNYSGRTFATFNGTSAQTGTITGQNVPNASGWADGTDADFADTHGLSFFRFTLQASTTVTVTVDAVNPSALLPGFSIFKGLGETGAFPDYETDITWAYLATLGDPQPRKGAFNALATWRMGTEHDSDYTNFSDLSTFTYMGHAADGTSLNLGPTQGLNGDGLADGHVSRAFTLAAGDYTLVIGGATYGVPGVGAQGIITTVSTVPEPSSAWLALGSGGMMLGWKRRRSRWAKPR